ncbi:MAG TPA: type II secretion system F family protein [Candidatus Omnitrophota bacterium]|nr:type II secretion system F family protein [Candidatus Omnitrophota bacterium]
MPNFHYIVKDAQGKTLEVDTEAYDKNSLIQKLQRQGYFIIKIEEGLSAEQKRGQERAFKQKSGDRKFGYSKVKLTDLLSFARQLTTMLEAGVSLLRSIDVITDQTESAKFYKILTKVKSDVEQGSSLSQALNQHPKVFNQFWVTLVEVGEASGTLPTVLNRLAFYLEQSERFRSTIMSAILYPAVLFMICLGAISIFALFIGPRFETVFESMGVELPGITKVLLNTFRFIKMNFFKIVMAAWVAVFLFKKWTKTTPGRRKTEQFMYSLPTFGAIYKLTIVERFTSQMAILVESGVPILHALDISERLVDNLTCAAVVNDIKEAVRQGELLVGPMERSQFFPVMCLQMISVGEESGELSKMLRHVATFYQETVETAMKRFATLIEPFMLVFMGTVIGVIVLAMFLPMFNIAQLGGAK